MATWVQREWGNGQSVFLLVFFPFGSQNETPPYRGGMHVLEHMKFQGVENAVGMTTWDEITEQFEPNGTVNAMTTPSYVGYWCHVRADRAEAVATKLGQLAMHTPLLPESQVAKEIEVVVRELEEAEDSPSDTCAEQSLVTLYGADTPHGWSVGATPKEVRRLTRKNLLDLHRVTHQSKPRVIVLGSGNNATRARQALVTVADNNKLNGGVGTIVQDDTPPTFVPPSTRWIQRDTKTLHTIVQFPCKDTPLGHPDFYALFVLAKLLGGRMGSRLTKALRKQGMVYSVRGNLHADQYHSVLQIGTGFNRTEGMRAMMTCLAQTPTQKEVHETVEWVKTQRSLANGTRPSTVAAELTEYLRCRPDLVKSYEWNQETDKYTRITTEDVVAVWKKHVHGNEPYVTTVGKETLPRV